MGLTLTWLSVIILIPLAGLFLKTFELSFDQFWGIVTSRRTLSALKISFGLSFAAALVNLVMGTIIVWALVRYRFPGRRLFDAIVDIPFALPTAVAGVALTQLFAQKGWLGAPLAELGIKVAFTPIGIFVAMIFIGIPFVVRTVQPVLLDLDVEIEEAAASLGANRWHTVFRVILPSLIPALLTGFALAFARAAGGNRVRRKSAHRAGAGAVHHRRPRDHLPIGLCRAAAGRGVRAGLLQGHRRLFFCARRAGGTICDPADAVGGRDFRQPQSGVRRDRGLGDREIRVHRQDLPDHADRPAVLGQSGDLRSRLRAAVRRAGL